MKIAILGGGITGVTAARQLAAAGHEIALFEATGRLAGLCASTVRDGFVADHAGGHILFSKDREVMAFMLAALDGIGYHTTRRETTIRLKGRYVHYPFENGLGDLADDDRFTCLKDYILAWHERRSGVQAPKDFESWCTWRFGRGICDLFMHPYNRKIWNVPLAELGTAWVEGRVPDAPMEDVLKSALGTRTEGYVHQSVFHYPLTGGFESLVRGMARPLRRECIRLETPVTSVAKDGTGFAVNCEHFEQVVSTIPLQVLGRVLAGVPSALKQSFGALDHVSLRNVFVALDKSDPPPLSWIYFPHESDGPQNRVTWLSNYSPQNAPAGKSSVMAEVTWYRNMPESAATTTEAVVSGLVKNGLFDRDQVQFTEVFDVPHAYILYRHGLEAELENLRAYTASLGLHVVGRFGNYSYFNSDACVRAAMDLAASITARA